MGGKTKKTNWEIRNVLKFISGNLLLAVLYWEFVKFFSSFKKRSTYMLIAENLENIEVLKV